MFKILITTVSRTNPLGGNVSTVVVEFENVETAQRALESVNQRGGGELFSQRAIRLW